MIEWVVLILLALVVVAVCLHNRNLKEQAQHALDVDAALAKKALNMAVLAAEQNSIPSAVATARACATIESLVERYGAANLGVMLGLDMKEIFQTLQDQHDRCLQDARAKHPEAFRDTNIAKLLFGKPYEAAFELDDHGDRDKE